MINYTICLSFLCSKHANSGYYKTVLPVQYCDDYRIMHAYLTSASPTPGTVSPAHRLWLWWTTTINLNHRHLIEGGVWQNVSRPYLLDMNLYSIYTGIYNFQVAARYLQVCNKISTKYLQYLHIYGVYNLAARYLQVHNKVVQNNPQIPMVSMVSTIFLQDIYELLCHLQPSMVTTRAHKK